MGRGYHIHLQPGEGPALTRPIHDIEAGFVMSPLKVCGYIGVELPTEMPHQTTDRLLFCRNGGQAYDMKHQLDQTP